MKILYSVQATGNGHISRAMELLPHLRKYGTIDIFLSGNNSNLAFDAPIKYRSKGISLYYNCRGGLNYWQLAKNFQPLRVRQEIRDLPVEKYDLILNDFDFITSSACSLKKVPSIHFGHQASFQSQNTPRPKTKNKVGEWLLRNYVIADDHIGFHFSSYDTYIFEPVIKKEILNSNPLDKGYITVYLPSFCEPQLRTTFLQIKDHRFEIFCCDTRSIKTERNLRFSPVDKTLFNESLINCKGIICGAGFETPAEALQLGKKLMVMPIRGQYEQLCNAEALIRLGVHCLQNIESNFKSTFYSWIQKESAPKKDYSSTIAKSLEHLFSLEKKSMEEKFHADYLIE